MEGDTQDKLVRIAVVGPESTGKSTIAHALARHYDTVCVPEYARIYCEGLNRQYTLQDELNMFYGQIALENSMVPLARHGMLICDTMFLTVKIWCEHLFGHSPQPVLDALKHVSYDFYLLMDIDLPWEDDPLRDFPDDREHFMQVWHRELQAVGARYQVVSGLGQHRVSRAIHYVEQVLTEM